MLDQFLEVALAEKEKNDVRQEMVSAFMHFPDDELHKLASGEAKLADFGGEDNLEKFEGTPLYDQALALEEEKLELDIQDQQQRLADNEEKREERGQRDSVWDAKDAIRLKQRMLELELRKSQLGTGGDEGMEEGMEEGEPEPPAPAPEVPTAEEEVAPEKLGAVDYFHYRRQQGLKLLGGLIKEAVCKEKSGGNLPEALQKHKVPKGTDIGKPGYEGGHTGKMPAEVEAKLKAAAASMIMAKEKAEGEKKSDFGADDMEATASAKMIDAFEEYKKESRVKVADSALEKVAAERGDELTAQERFAIFHMAKTAGARLEAGVPLEDLEDFEKVALVGSALKLLGGAAKYVGSGAKAGLKGAKGVKGAAPTLLQKAKGGLTGGVKAFGDVAQRSPLTAAGLAGGAALGVGGLGYAAG